MHTRSLATEVMDLIRALQKFIEDNSLDPNTCFFWVCDYTIRQVSRVPGGGWLGGGVQEEHARNVTLAPTSANARSAHHRFILTVDSPFLFLRRFDESLTPPLPCSPVLAPPNPDSGTPKKMLAGSEKWCGPLSIRC